MKILWISAKIFDEKDEKQSGVWQKALAEQLCLYPEIQILNVSYQSGIKYPVFSVYKNIKQWAIPRIGKLKNGMPPKSICDIFSKIVNEFNPDIIHIWGTENVFKLLPFNKNLPGKKVLVMQGVMASIGDKIFEGLTLKEALSTIGLREIFTNNSLFSIQKSFYKVSAIEQQMINAADAIITQSEWTEAQLKTIRSNITFYRINVQVREAFLNSEKWLRFRHNSPIIYTPSWGYSFKGLHIAIKALSIVKQYYPDVQLNIAGAVGRKDILGDGYLRFILRLIKKHDLNENIVWLGAIDANTIVNQLQHASVFVHASFVESYSVALAEAMCIGTPSVVSYAGAMPELAMHGKEALFFPPGDYKTCAYLIVKLISNRELSMEISRNAILRSEQRELNTNAAQQQLFIYQKILNDRN
jgi:glycosyltransferase involved in cell wall biosynthesis